MVNVLKKIGGHKLIPVVTIDGPDNTLQLGKALLKGGLPVAEITFRTEAAEEAIRILTEELPDMLVGAGTVLSIQQVKNAVNAGAKFIVAPGFNPGVVDYCIENQIPVIPGISNPTLIEMALERGLKVVKFFPAEASGGLAYLKAIGAPYGDIKFIPTGGISQSNLKDYLDYTRVHACGGSWMVKASLIAGGRFEEISRLTLEAVSLIRSCHGII